MPDWEDSPWYPTMRLFRQPAPWDWESVMARVLQELSSNAQKSSTVFTRVYIIGKKCAYKQ